MAAFGARHRVGDHEDLDLGVREDHGADVTPFHHDAAALGDPLASDPALLVYEPGAYARERADAAGGLTGLGRADALGYVLGVEEHAEGALRVFLHAEDVTERIRTPEASEAASRVSALPSVRARLVDEQRRIARERIAEGGGVVMEGRDIGTVVFPDAEVKVFMVANPMARAERRHRELADRGEDVSLDAVADEIAARDARDSQRAVAPLRPAEDAVTLDTTRLSIDEQVERVLALVRERSAESPVQSGPARAALPHSRPTS